MTIATALTRLLKIEHPVLLAPMAGVSGGAMAAAVSNAGGLGIIGGGYGERESLEREFAAAGNVPVGIGFITWSLQRNPDLLDVALAHAPKVMFLSFGELGAFAPKVKKAGIPLIAQVQTLAQARRAVGEGADDQAIVPGTIEDAARRRGVRRKRRLGGLVGDELDRRQHAAAADIADQRMGLQAFQAGHQTGAGPDAVFQ